MLTQILTIAIWTGAGMMAGGAIILIAAFVVACVASLFGWSPEWFE